jgi:hypothetical protein
MGILLGEVHQQEHEKLLRILSGTRLLEKGNAEYEARRVGGCFSKRVDGVYPRAIAIVECVEEVVACIKFASACGLKVCVRSGGHNYYSNFLQNGTFLIDTGSLNGVQIDASAGTAVVGPSATGGALNEAAALHGLMFPSGHCPGVPLGGFLLGGGYGWFFDHFGYSCESVLSATVVTPAGNVVDVKLGEGGCDWAYMIKGAASLFPGVVVSFKLHLHPLPQIMRTASWFYSVDDLAVMSAWLRKGKESKQLSSKLELTLILATAPPWIQEELPPCKIVMTLHVSFMADSEDEASSLILAPLDHLPVKPLFARGKFADTSIVSLCEIVGEAYPQGMRWFSHMLSMNLIEDRSLPFESMMENLCNALAETGPKGCSSLLCCFMTPGKTSSGVIGSMGTILLGWTAFHPDASGDASAKLWMDEAYGIVVPHKHRLNCLENPLNGKNANNSFPEGAFERLCGLRDRLDPCHLFFDMSSI